MIEVFRTMIVTAAQAPLARSLAAGLSPRGAGMFTTGLSATGKEPATHYVSTGMIDAEMAALLGDADALHAAGVAAGAQVALEQCRALIASSDVTDHPPFEVFDRIGLKIVSSEY